MKNVIFGLCFCVNLHATQKEPTHHTPPSLLNQLRQQRHGQRETPVVNPEPRQQLLQAAHTGNLAEITRLIRQGVDIHGNNEEALKIAFKKGYTEIIEALVQAGADTSIDNYALLIRAHLQNKNQLLLALTGMPLERAYTYYQCSPKAYYKFSEIFGKIFDPQETILELALLCACVDNNLEVARAMLEKGANAKVRNGLPLLLAAHHPTQDLAALLQSHINTHNSQ